VFTALEMAIGQRKPHNVIHHSDRGNQYTALAFGGCCREAGISAACPAILSGNGERLRWCRLPHRLTGAASNGMSAVFEWGFPSSRGLTALCVSPALG
jgi:hypothetical protein